jgi:hypothetical protein
MSGDDMLFSREKKWFAPGVCQRFVLQQRLKKIKQNFNGILHKTALYP